MSEFQERHTVSRLVGAPPGYVGYEEAGQLTEAVRRTPYAVLLLDEIEKAHADVFNMLLQVLDDGRLTDGQGRTVDFKNTVVIMTSNLGSDVIGRRRRRLRRPRGRRRTRQDRLMGRLREAFRPEFLNRIDEIIVFRQLDQAQLRQITEPAAGGDHGGACTRRPSRWSSPPRRSTGWPERGYQPEFGARPLRRTIQREVDNQLSAMLLDGRLTPHQHVITATEGDAITFRVTELDPAHVRPPTSRPGPTSPASPARTVPSATAKEVVTGRHRRRLGPRVARRWCPGGAGRRPAGRWPGGRSCPAGGRPACPTGWRRSARPRRW